MIANSVAIDWSQLCHVDTTNPTLIYYAQAHEGLHSGNLMLRRVALLRCTPIGVFGMWHVR